LANYWTIHHKKAPKMVKLVKQAGRLAEKL